MSDSLKRSRILQACENCRALKARCLPSKVVGTCEKCLRGHRHCIPHVPKPQSERAKRSKKDFASIEARIQGLYHLIENKVLDSSAVKAVEHDLRSSTRDSTGDALLQALGGPHRFEPKDVAKCAAVNSAHANRCLATYRQKMSAFPYVLISTSTSFEDLVRQRPLVALAVLLVSEQEDLNFMWACESLFRQAVARKAIVLGERSMDILQGLLLYLGWQHYYFKKETQQTHAFVNIAVSLAVDMNSGRSRAMGNTCHAPVKDHDPIANDRKRAVLGLYFLSCSIVMVGFYYPSSMPYNPEFASYAKELAEKARYPTDRHLPAEIELLHIAEDATSFIRSYTGTSIDESEMRAGINQVEKRLKKWDTDYADAPTSTKFSRDFVLVYIYENAFFMQQPQTPKDSANTFSLFELSTLLLCYEKTKTTLDEFLAQTETIIQCNMIQWSHLITAVIILARISRPLHAVNTTAPSNAQDMVKVGEYMSVICDRLEREASDTSQLGSLQARNMSIWLPHMCEGILKWATSSLESPRQEQTSAGIKDSAASFERITSTYTSNTRLGPSRVDQAVDSDRAQPEHQLLGQIALDSPDSMSINGPTTENSSIGSTNWEHWEFNGNLWGNFIWDWPKGVSDSSYNGLFPD